MSEQVTGECSYGLHTACPRASRSEGSTGWQMSLPCECLCHTKDAVTCHKCGAVVEDDALARQTMADGTLMWPEPFCRACLLAGLRRLKAWLATGGAGAMGEDGE